MAHNSGTIDQIQLATSDYKLEHDTKLQSKFQFNLFSPRREKSGGEGGEGEGEETNGNENI